MRYRNLQETARLVEDLFPAVNERIAPAKLERVYPSEELQSVRVRGRWGTVRFDFTISEDLVWQSNLGAREMVGVLERHAVIAVDGALGSLVAQQVAAKAKAVQEQMKKYVDDAVAVIQAEFDKRPVPKPAWYIRAWRRLNTPL